MNSNIVRAWKDEFYRESLSDEERAQLPENPVGELELTDAELGSVFAAGGRYDPGHDENFRFSYKPYVCPRYSYRNWDDCHPTYHPYGACHNYSYGGHWDDCHPRTIKYER